MANLDPLNLAVQRLVFLLLWRFLLRDINVLGLDKYFLLDLLNRFNPLFEFLAVSFQRGVAVIHKVSYIFLLAADAVSYCLLQVGRHSSFIKSHYHILEQAFHRGVALRILANYGDDNYHKEKPVVVWLRWLAIHFPELDNCILNYLELRPQASDSILMDLFLLIHLLQVHLKYNLDPVLESLLLKFNGRARLPARC